MDDQDMALLRQLKDLYAKGILSKEEYDARRLPIIDRQLGTSGATASGAPKSPRAGATAQPASPPPSQKSPRGGDGASTSVRSTSTTDQGRPSSPRRIDVTSGYQPDASPASGGASPPKKFDASIKYDPHNVKKSYKDDHERAAMPTPPRGQVGERYKMPEGLSAFTALKVVQEPEKPKIGVYLGPTGHSGGVWQTQSDVRRKEPIGGPEVSTKGHIGSAASSVSSVTIYTAGAPTFQERVYVNTSCIDLISSCVKQLGIAFPPSLFGMISRAPSGDSWITPDSLVSDVATGGVQLIVVPKEGSSTDVKKAYFDKISSYGKAAATGAPFESDSNWTADDVATAPNPGKQLYYAHK